MALFGTNHVFVDWEPWPTWVVVVVVAKYKVKLIRLFFDGAQARRVHVAPLC